MKLKIINLNLFEGGLFFDKILAFIEEQNADILCFQEVFNGEDTKLPQNYRSIEILQKALPNFEHTFAPEMLSVTDHGKIALGNALFSRYPITATNTTFLSEKYGEYPAKPKNNDWSRHPKNMQHAKINAHGHILNVFNLHGIWGLDGGDTPQRLEMSKRIIEQITNKQNTVLTGDFNLKPNTKTITNIEAHLKNVFKDQLTTSFNLKRKNLEKFPGYATAVVDMLFVSVDLNILAAECPQVDISDHLPLVCEIEL
jgi:endonuclease/exonuclease/phosphatase family metal-dependent hydrolase